MKILVTGGAGFIGSNLIDSLLTQGVEVVCLDNFSTGFEKNLQSHFSNPAFKLIKGDIRDINVCREAVKGCDLVSHQAALGSVPRSINDPLSTHDVNNSGFLHMLIAARDERVNRFVYAASSSTYGDSKNLPKIEEVIGKPLSPYAITKYVNELYAEVFAKTYNMQCIGLRYFNVFGQRQDPYGSYAAVIPVWVKSLINLVPPRINGDGSYSRDFTYIDNVIQANERALFQSTQSIIKGQKEYYNLELDQHKYLLQTSKNKAVEKQSGECLSEVFNVAYGGNTSLLDLFAALRDNLAHHQKNIGGIEPVFDPVRAGDIPHSQASILKAQTILGYSPRYSAQEGLALATDWYYRNLSNSAVKYRETKNSPETI